MLNYHIWGWSNWFQNSALFSSQCEPVFRKVGVFFFFSNNIGHSNKVNGNFQAQGFLKQRFLCFKVTRSNKCLGNVIFWMNWVKFFFSFMHSSCSTNHQKWCFVKNQWTIHWILYCIQNNIPLCGVIHVVHWASKWFLITWNMEGPSVVTACLPLTERDPRYLLSPCAVWLILTARTCTNLHRRSNLFFHCIEFSP